VTNPVGDTPTAIADRVTDAVPSSTAVPQYVPPSLRHRRLAAARVSRSPDGWGRRYAAVTCVGDLVAGAVGGGGAFAWRFGTGHHYHYALLSAAFPIGFVAFLYLHRAYDRRFLGTGTDEFRRVGEAAFRYGAALALISFALTTFTALLIRHLNGLVLRRLRRAGRCTHRVLVVGRERSVARLVTSPEMADAGLQVVAACVDGAPADLRRVDGVPVLGNSGDVVDALVMSGADTLAITAWTDLSQEDVRRISWQLEGSGIAFLLEPRLTDIAGPRIQVRQVAGLPLLHVEEPEFTGPRRLAKGLLDRCLALLLAIMLSPLLLALAIAVRASGRGPVVFRQQRIGALGRPFTMYKFRTMRPDAEACLQEVLHLNDYADGVMFKAREDPRVTAVGRFLRRYSLDELPQLFNVLRGQMSLVGPRPPLQTEVEKYADEVHRRLLVKPGMTGLWQVSGRNDLSWAQSVRLDLFYVENWSLALDLTILARTFLSVVGRTGH
jgi:exopolysaccharide biosynthesis polyprenyl glycosylphosphotransferase